MTEKKNAGDKKCRLFMETFFTLASACNTINPALFVLKKKGYQLRISRSTEAECIYVACKEGRQFVGNSAPEILGLVAMWEYFGDNWRDELTEIPDLLAEVATQEDGQ